MNHLLNDRLQECKLSLSDIQHKIIETPGNSSVFIYTSHLEGLGTKNSDFDIYVICENLPNTNFLIDHGKYKISNTIINSTLLDIEYWHINEIIKLIEKVNSSTCAQINTDELKLLHRLRIAELIQGDYFSSNIKANIANSNLQQNILHFYKVQANSFLEDAVYMFKSNEFICSMNCAYKALDSAIGALNAKNNITNLKGKWISKLFINQNNCDKSILDQYLKYQIYTNVTQDNIESFLEDKIEFIQNILSAVSFE